MRVSFRKTRHCNEDVPVDASHSGVLAEGRRVLPGLLPNLFAMLDVVRGVDGIVDPEDHDECPSEGHKNSIGVQCVSIMGFTPSKWVIGRHDVL